MQRIGRFANRRYKGTQEMLDYSIANNIIRRLMSAIILHMPAFKDRPWQFLYCAQVLPFNRRINIGAPRVKKYAF
jgi:hypothetical protein